MDLTSQTNYWYFKTSFLFFFFLFFSDLEWVQDFKFFCEAKIMKRDISDTSIHNNCRIKYHFWPETDLNLHYFLNVYATFLQLKRTGALSLQPPELLEQKTEYCPQSAHLFGLSWTHSAPVGVSWPEAGNCTREGDKMCRAGNLAQREQIHGVGTGALCPYCPCSRDVTWD